MSNLRKAKSCFHRNRTSARSVDDSPSLSDVGPSLRERWCMYVCVCICIETLDVELIRVYGGAEYPYPSIHICCFEYVSHFSSLEKTSTNTLSHPCICVWVYVKTDCVRVFFSLYFICDAFLVFSPHCLLGSFYA